MKDIRRLIVKGICLMALFIVIDQAFILFRYTASRGVAEINLAKAEQMMSDFMSFKGGRLKGADILVLGASYAQFGVDTDLISTLLSRHANNLAYGGGFHIGDQRKLLELFLLHHPPPRLILYVSNGTDFSKGSFDRDSLVRKLLVLKNDGNPLFWLLDWDLLGVRTLIKSYRYGQNVEKYLVDCSKGACTLPLFRSAANTTFDTDEVSDFGGYTISETGYVSIKGRYNGRGKETDIEEKFKSYDRPVRDFNAIIDICRKNNIAFIFVNVPFHRSCKKYYSQAEEINHWLRALSLKSGFIYYSLTD
ncbi:MAG: hypothetical protein HQL22_11100, partial [Candidatus Omnitrophica bacterium]|nr:hypothetical protein [Candidatus Omnitrophota bacterium]